MMSSLFIRFSLIFTFIHLTLSQQYVVRRDFRSSYQFNSFTVFSFDERQIIYRIETQYSLAYAGTIKHVLPLNDLIIVAHIDAFLGSDQVFQFRILNRLTGRWISGRVFQRNLFVYLIELSNFQQMIIESTPSRTPAGASLQRVRFFDGLISARTYAEYYQRAPWVSVYDLQMFTNEYPVELYLLGLAIVQRRN